MTSAASILFEINSSNYNTGIFTIYKPPVGYSGFVTTLRLTIDIKSISTANFPYIPEETPPNVLQEILEKVALNTPYKEVVLFYKKGEGAWIQRAPIMVFNKEPFYDVNLMRYYSDANTIDVAEDFSLGIQLRLGNVLASTDKIAVWGSAVEEKKNNGNEELAAGIEALQLALSGKITDLPANILLGRNTGSGIVQQIPQSQFAKSADIDTAIFNLIGSAPDVLDTLAEIAQALADDANFAATITNLLALKAPLNSPSFTGNLTSNGKIIPAANPAVNWGIDFASGTSTISLASGATYDLATGSGMVVIYDNVDGGFNFLFASAGAVISVASAVGSIVAGSPPSEKVGLFYNGATLKYRIFNNRTTTRTLIISSIRMRSVS